ncbi:MAG: DUF3168 domain-containing protein [Alphaproteobacteria bacterium]|nr:MAG: DUF3168 domain-containing protein [Alphaproteobacteria bacterium]
MTYALSWPLQEAVFARLSADPTLSGLVGGRIYDAAPHAVQASDPLEDYVTLGEEVARAFDTATDHGASFDFAVAVHSGRQGYARAKAIAGAICDALIDAPLSLSRGKLIGLRFLQAQAQRGRPPVRRRIVLRFRAVIEDS